MIDTIKFLIPFDDQPLTELLKGNLMRFKKDNVKTGEVEFEFFSSNIKLAKAFLDLKFDEELINLSYEDYKARNGQKIAYTENILSNLKKELDGLSTKESMLTDSYSSQVLRKDLYEEKMKDIALKRVELEKQIEENQKKSGVTEVTFVQIRNVFIEGSKATEQYINAKDEAKRLLLEKLLSNATIKNKSVAQYQFKSPYQVLANTPKNITFEKMCAIQDSNL